MPLAITIPPTTRTAKGVPGDVPASDRARLTDLVHEAHGRPSAARARRPGSRRRHRGHACGSEDDERLAAGGEAVERRRRPRPRAVPRPAARAAVRDRGGGAARRPGARARPRPRRARHDDDEHGHDGHEHGGERGRRRPGHGEAEGGHAEGAQEQEPGRPLAPAPEAPATQAGRAAHPRARDDQAEREAEHGCGCPCGHGRPAGEQEHPDGGLGHVGDKRARPGHAQLARIARGPPRMRELGRGGGQKQRAEGQADDLLHRGRSVPGGVPGTRAPAGSACAAATLRGVRRTGIGVLLVASACLWPQVASACTARVVTKARVHYRHTATIQAAVNQARPCDWIVIAPGTYPESVTIRKPRLHLRGMSRNGVVIDGRHRANANGIVVRANDVSVENLTARNFDGGTPGTGNQIWWNGGLGSLKPGLHGWFGNYLTTYDTGLAGGRGLAVSNADEGEWNQVYASGLGHAGLSLSACRDCHATVTQALAEGNAVGFWGANAGGPPDRRAVDLQGQLRRAGGHVRQRRAASAPARDVCRGREPGPAPAVTTTRLTRCTFFRNNTVAGNNDLTTPVDAAAARLPWGTGILLAGTYGDLVQANTVTGQQGFGILGYESPDPFPPTATSVAFQLSGNRLERNTVSGSGLADIALEGGLYGTKTSVDRRDRQRLHLGRPT